MPEITTRVNVEAEEGIRCVGGGVVVIYATFPSLLVAEQIGGELVTAGLAACVNVIPGMRSIYRWAGEIQRDEEVIAIVKTRAGLANRVVGWIRVAHPYSNPAALVLLVADGSADFLAWVVAETASAEGA